MLEIIVWGAQTRSFRQEQEGPTAYTLQQAKAASQAIEEVHILLSLYEAVIQLISNACEIVCHMGDRSCA